MRIAVLGAGGQGVSRVVLAEVDTIGRVAGIYLASDYHEQLEAFGATLEPSACDSLCYDLRVGRRLALESLNGTVVRLGRRWEIPTPYNFVISAALKPYANEPPPLL